MAIVFYFHPVSLLLFNPLRLKMCKTSFPPFVSSYISFTLPVRLPYMSVAPPVGSVC